MTPVYQDKFGPGRGNCQQAAVASILGVPLYAVPDFHDDTGDVLYHSFLASKGFVSVRLPPERAPDCYYIAHGPSIVSGNPHACVYRAGELRHDPHPGRNGLSNVEDIFVIVPMEIDISGG